MIRAQNSPPSPIQYGWETMGHTLTEGTRTDRRNDAGSDGTPPGETKRGLGMAYQYRTTERKNQNVTICRQLSASLGGTWKNPKQDLHRERPLGFLSRSNGSGKHTKGHVRSKGTPHVGHAASIMNNEHASWSDISDWSSSDPITRVIKVTLPTPAIFL